MWLRDVVSAAASSELQQRADLRAKSHTEKCVKCDDALI